MTSLFQILLLLIDVAFMIVLIHIIMSWLINFSVLNLRQPLVAQIWHGLNGLVEPIYGPIRRRLPAMGGAGSGAADRALGAVCSRNRPAQQRGVVSVTTG